MLPLRVASPDKNSEISPKTVLARGHATFSDGLYLRDNNRDDNGVIEFFHKWLDEHQDPNTGFWGSDKWPLHLGAAGYFKLVSHGGTYRRYGWKPHYRDKVVDICLRIQDEHGRFGSTDACINWDALKNLRVVSREFGYYRWQDVRLASARSVLTIRACWKEDECGFSTSPAASCTGHCAMELAPSRNEADMHAFTIWTSIPEDILLILLDDGPYRGQPPFATATCASCNTMGKWPGQARSGSMRLLTEASK